MDFHPAQIPIAKTFHLKDEKDASDAAQEMVKIGFFSDDKGFKVLMPKETTFTFLKSKHLFIAEA